VTRLMVLQSCRLQATLISLRRSKKCFFPAVQALFRNAGVTFRACRRIQQYLRSDNTRLSGSIVSTMAQCRLRLNAVLGVSGGATKPYQQ
jgi:hypothetical protein